MTPIPTPEQALATFQRLERRLNNGGTNMFLKHQDMIAISQLVRALSVQVQEAQGRICELAVGAWVAREVATGALGSDALDFIDGLLDPEEEEMASEIYRNLSEKIASGELKPGELVDAEVIE